MIDLGDLQGEEARESGANGVNDGREAIAESRQYNSNKDDPKETPPAKSVI